MLPQHATLHLFADVRYMLWVNGRYVERGPARFEPAAPEYDSVDITKFLRAGENLISILVTAQISNGRTRLHEPCLLNKTTADQKYFSPPMPLGSGVTRPAIAGQ